MRTRNQQIEAVNRSLAVRRAVHRLAADPQAAVRLVREGDVIRRKEIEPVTRLALVHLAQYRETLLEEVRTCVTKGTCCPDSLVRFLAEDGSVEEVLQQAIAAHGDSEKPTPRVVEAPPSPPISTRRSKSETRPKSKVKVEEAGEVRIWESISLERLDELAPSARPSNVPPFDAQHLEASPPGTPPPPPWHTSRSSPSAASPQSSSSKSSESLALEASVSEVTKAGNLDVLAKKVADQLLLSEAFLNAMKSSSDFTTPVKEHLRRALENIDSDPNTRDGESNNNPEPVRRVKKREDAPLLPSFPIPGFSKKPPTTVSKSAQTDSIPAPGPDSSSTSHEASSDLSAGQVPAKALEVLMKRADCEVVTVDTGRRSRVTVMESRDKELRMPAMPSLKTDEKESRTPRLWEVTSTGKLVPVQVESSTTPPMSDDSQKAPGTEEDDTLNLVSPIATGGRRGDDAAAARRRRDDAGEEAMSECGITNPYMNARAKNGEAYEPTRHEHVANTLSHADRWRRDSIVKILTETRFGRLVNVYMIDHCIEENYGLLPTSCRDLKKLEPETWAKILDVDQEVGTLLPLSILALRRAVSLLAFKRKAIRGPREFKRSLGLTIKEVDEEEFRPLKQAKALHVKMKEKKRHEVERLAGCVRALNEDGHFDEVVDVGAGLGHLSRVLATELESCQVRTVEGNEELVDTARRLDERLERSADFQKPEREARFIREDADELCGNRALLLGLHACGELSAWLLRRMKRVEPAGLFLVSCCHHKLNADSFPLSKAFEGVRLSYAARELACHAQEQLQDRLKTAKKEDFMEQACRAALEWAIVTVLQEEKTNRDAEGRGSSESYRRLGLKGAKKTLEDGFEAYAKKALEGYPLIWQKLEGREELKRAEELAKESVGGLIAVHVLRTLLASLIETLIIEDRVLALKEWGWNAQEIAVFDPVISPRNFAIVAWK